MKAARPGVLLVAERELRWMIRDRLAIMVAIAIPLIGFALLSWTFSHAVVRDLRIDVVDGDRSPTSTEYVQAIGSAPGVSVTSRSGDLTEALHSIRSGRAIAAVYIPPDFERDLLSLKRPQIVTFYNRQFYSPGNSASSAITSAVNAETARLVSKMQVSGAGFEPGQLVAEQYVLSNPALNYAQFLLRAILPTVLHVAAAIAGGYAVGSEFSSRDPAEWLRTAGGSPLAAIVGKLLPLLGIFMIIVVGTAVIVDGLYHVPFRGNTILMAAAATQLVIGYLSLGALLQLLVRNLGVGLSLTGIICSPAFGFSGVGFPLLGMNLFARLWGDCLPLRWYIQILIDQAIRGLPPQNSVEPFAVLGGLATLYFGLAWLRLRNFGDLSRPAAPLERPRSPDAVRQGIGRSMLRELKSVLGNKTALGMILIAPVIYGFLYPQPYLGQVLKRIPIAVVDQDRTELSRDIVEALNADEALSVDVRATTLADAQKALGERKVFGIIGIPPDTEKEVLKGNPARLPAYVDAAYFMMYTRMQLGISEALEAANVAIEASGARLDGSLAHAAVTRASPVDALAEPLYNPTGGYASYIVPAAFMLILQQTQFMAIAAIGGGVFQSGGVAARRQRNRPRAIIGQAIAHLILALPAFALFLIVLPRVYGFSTLGSPLHLLVMVIPFVLAISFLAQFAGSWFKRGESVVILFVATSLPLFFMVGISWPADSIPPVLRALSRLFPSTSAIDGLVRINQMGATISDVSVDWRFLWLLVCIYGLLAIASGLIRNGVKSHDA
jgi:ABC-2 type transport system permease protein